MSPEVRAGYKQTEVGAIPEDWEVKRLSECTERVVVGIASAASHAYRESGIPMLRNQNIKYGYLDASDIIYLDPDYEKAFKNKRLRPGDLITARTGYPGATCVVKQDFAGAQCFTSLISTPRSVIRSEFLSLYINSEFGRNYIAIAQIGGAQQNVNSSALKKMPIVVPPLPEQWAIASAFADVDALLDSLEELLTKKRRLKQAAMQELLTAKTRLEGFEGEWEEVRLGDVAVFLSNGSNSRAELSFDGSVKYLHYGDIHGMESAFVDVSSDHLPYLPLDKAGRLDRLRNGDLIFADASEDIDGIGKAVEVRNPESVGFVAGLHTIAVRFNQLVISVGFAGYLQYIPDFRTHIRSLASGTKVYAMTSKHIASANLFLPGIVEQKAIAAILSEMDGELEVLEERLSKTRDLKQGMMQELLTGRTRLI